MAQNHVQIYESSEAYANLNGNKMIILGIETSCDETAIALVNDRREILSNVVWSQLQKHREYGGVVPEISARAHLSRIGELIEQALTESGISLNDVDGIAATCGPGLIGGVMVGAMTGKALASTLGKPFLAINHLMGHALTSRLFDEIDFPYLLLLISGGHCQLLVVEAPLRYTLLGTTLDDAVGEAFDKVGKLMGINYPAGPQIEQMAKQGDPKAYKLPKPLLNRKGSCDFSFSGLKTAVRQILESSEIKTSQEKAHLAAAFQDTVAEVLANRSQNALEFCEGKGIDLQCFVVAGGVAANQYIYARLHQIAKNHNLPFKAPPVSFCTDNGAMIAWAGVELMQQGLKSPLSFAPRPRWPLTDLKEIKGSYQ